MRVVRVCKSLQQMVTAQAWSVPESTLGRLTDTPGPTTARSSPQPEGVRFVFVIVCFLVLSLLPA